MQAFIYTQQFHEQEAAARAAATYNYCIRFFDNDNTINCKSSEVAEEIMADYTAAKVKVYLTTHEV